MKLRLIILPFIVGAHFAAFQVPAKAQSLSVDAGDSSATVAGTNSARPDLSYDRPSQTTKIRNYALDAFGPLPIGVAAVEAGINQEDNSPPEWKQGVDGYSKRFGSDLAIEAVSTTTRYALSEAFREDALYYRCDCKGVFPRLSHAVISTLTAHTMLGYVGANISSEFFYSAPPLPAVPQCI